MAKLAALPVPLKEKPSHGSREGMERIREQARIQVQSRTVQKPIHELLEVIPPKGFCTLPEPAAGDMFVDLEGDPFAGALEATCGQEYLYGFACADGEEKLRYEKRWALTIEEEKQGFEWLIDQIVWRRQKFPQMHVYHFGHCERDRFIKLAGTYASREEEVDSMLRSELLVDLHTVVKQSLRASVEEYSLKKMEAFYGFERKTSLAESRTAMRYVEHKMQLGWGGEKLPDKYREVMEGYNSEDCFSTAALRDWLEAERQKLVDNGALISRPEVKDGAPSEKLKERQVRVAELLNELCAGIPINPPERSREQSASWLLAQLLDWHRREDRRAWQEGYRLAAMGDEAMIDERVGLTGLRFITRLGTERNIPTDRYAFEPRKTDVRAGKDLYDGGQKFGEVCAIDCVGGVIEIKKTKKTAEIHPTSLYMWDRPLNSDTQAEAIFRIAQSIRDNGIDGGGNGRAIRDLLLRRPPNLLEETVASLPMEEVKATACRIAAALQQSVFAIQGPPGAGKTFTGARMICRLVGAGKKVGITALSHKVIRNLLDEVILAAHEENVAGIRCMQRINSVSPNDISPEIALARDNDAVLQALRTGVANVVGGTSWLWADEDLFEAVDSIFVDEAGQMALADVIAAGQSAKNVFLIGDPQQLQRPLQGSHPPGAEKSSLEYLIGDQKTISAEMGMLLPKTFRMHPKVCEFTSEMFYEQKLASHPITLPRIIQGHAWLSNPGLFFVAVKHDGNRNSCPEEADVVVRIVASLLKGEVKWFYSHGNSRRLNINEDILIVAPYNAQVSELSTLLPGAKIGTVDKFQGQEAPVVIYSLTTSTPEDAPRGMEFLYSSNRLNVATSRAKTAVILVGSPKLLEPECKTPRQMQLANALCRYLELATLIDAKFC